MRIIITPRFDRELDRLLRKQPLFAPRVQKTLQLLASNPRHPSLRRHKLGRKEKTYSISVDMSIRVVYFNRGDEIFLLRIGTHEDVY